ncbi:MAG: phosphatase PAP2 family protein [Bacteroidota bacterium]
MSMRNFSVTLSLLIVFININAQNWDIDLANNINPQNPNSGYWKFTSASTYLVSAAIPVGLLATGFIEKSPELKRKAYETFGGIVIEVIISETLKRAINRKRPGEEYPAIIFPYRNLRGKSFPSGHTSLAFATATSLSIQLRKWYVVVPAYLWAGSVGYSRMYLGVHYPSDVLAGAALGIGSAWLAHWLNKKVFANKKNQKQVE